MVDGHTNKRITDLERTAHRIEQKLNFLQAVVDNVREQYEARIAPQQSSDQENNAAERESAAKAEIPPAPANGNQSKKPWYKTIQGWKVLLELIGIPFAIGYAVVTGLQWHDARRNFEIDQRPWVKLQTGGDFVPNADPVAQKFVFDAVAGQPLKVPVRVINVGKTAALNVIVAAIIDIVPVGQSPHLPTGNEEITVDGAPAPKVPFPTRPIGVSAFKTAIIFPSDVDYDTMSRTVPDPNSQSQFVNPLLTDSEVLDLKADRTYLIVWGQIWYEDVLGRAHWTKFCTIPYINQRNTTVKKCAEYPGVDNN